MSSSFSAGQASNPIFAAPCKLAQDSSLSLQARGLLFYYMSLPYGWEHRPSKVQADNKIGKKLFWKLNTELFREGHLCAWQEQKTRDGWGKYHYEFYYSKKDCNARREELRKIKGVFLRENAPTDTFDTVTPSAHTAVEQALDINIDTKILGSLADPRFEEPASFAEVAEVESQEDDVMASLEASYSKAVEREKIKPTQRSKPSPVLKEIATLLADPSAPLIFPPSTRTLDRAKKYEWEPFVCKNQVVEEIGNKPLIAMLLKRIDWRVLKDITCEMKQASKTIIITHPKAFFLASVLRYLQKMSKKVNS